MDKENALNEENTANEDGLAKKFPDKIYDFMRPIYGEPKHIVLSSPFARRLMMAAAGPTKPPWYKQPSFAKFSTFKSLVRLVEAGRTGPVSFKDLMWHLKELDATFQPMEVLRILGRVAVSEEDELDFGEFVFLLANNPFYDTLLQEPRYEKYILKHLFSPRQRILYSGLVFYCFIQTEYDIARFYKGSHQHPDILSYHMAAARNEGLSETQMERKQEEAWDIVKKFTKEQRSPYTCPVPFVQASTKEHFFVHYLERRKTLPQSLLPKKPKKVVHRKVKPLKVERNLGEPVTFEDEDEYLIHLFKMAQLPRPDMKIPAQRLKEMRNSTSMRDKEYLDSLKEKAMKEYYDRLKRAAVEFTKKGLRYELRKGFSDQVTKLMFFDIVKTIMPISVDEFFVLKPWVPPTMAEGKPKSTFERPPFGKAAD